MKNEKHFYIYNPMKANYLLQNGVTLLEIGIGKVDGVFFKFLKNDKSKEVANQYKQLNQIDN